jgi:hypothetical protein
VTTAKVPPCEGAARSRRDLAQVAPRLGSTRRVMLVACHVGRDWLGRARRADDRLPHGAASLDASPTAGGVPPDSAIGARAAAISGPTVNDIVFLLVRGVVGVDDDDPAGEVARRGPRVDVGQRGQRHALGDVDA